MLKGIVLKRVLPFVLAAFSGAFVYYMFAPIGVPAVQTAVSGSGFGSSGGVGSASCRAPGTGHDDGWSWETFEPENKSAIPLKIVSKPRAAYTDLARENNVTGSVRLKVTLLASGNVGGVSVVRGLPDGLTEQAITAARKIKFEPKRVNGRPVSTTVTIDYSFDIY